MSDDFTNAKGARIPPGIGPRAAGMGTLVKTIKRTEAFLIGSEVTIWAKLTPEGDIRLVMRAPKRMRISTIPRPADERAPDAPQGPSA